MLGDLSNKLNNFQVTLILLGAAFIVALLSGSFEGRWVFPEALPMAEADIWNTWWSGFWQNFATEVFGAVLTFVFLQNIVGTRERAEAETRQSELLTELREELQGFLEQQQADLDERERRRLINQTTSTVPGFAAEAVRLLKHHDAQLTEEQRQAGEGWYSPDMIVDAVRARGELSKVNLRQENLEGAHLGGPSYRARTWGEPIWRGRPWGMPS